MISQAMQRSKSPSHAAASGSKARPGRRTTASQGALEGFSGNAQSSRARPLLN
jgi:hypothetical protein